MSEVVDHIGPFQIRGKLGRGAMAVDIITDARLSSGSATFTFAFYAFPVRRSARLVAERRLGEKRTNRTYSCRFRCTLDPGIYLCMVKATDAAGNESRTSIDPKSPVFRRVCNQLRVR